MGFSVLRDPEYHGALVLPRFADKKEIDAIYTETEDPERVQWLDAHDVYVNNRGLTIIQNHYTFALRTDAGDPSYFDRIPTTVAMQKRIRGYIQGKGVMFPFLRNWVETEVSFHKYDNQELGLSYHRDNDRFVGLIAALAVNESCDMAILHRGEEHVHTVNPGDLALFRGSKLIDFNGEVRPEHEIRNLQGPTRTSMMMRMNNKPSQPLKGFRFNNWEPPTPLTE